MKSRFVVREFGGAKAICDRQPLAHPCLFGFGWGNPQTTFQQHRETYTNADAQAVCDWLNERETWPEFQGKQNAVL